MSRRHIRLAAYLAALVAGLGLWLLGQGGAAQAPKVAVLTVKGAIGPGVAGYIDRGIDKAVSRGAGAIVLRLDTPGGLVTSTREIIEHILASPVPVIGYVSPPGAHAASAGTYILYGTHIAAMAPATNIGAATPVTMGGQPSGPEQDKKPRPGIDDDAEPAKDKDADEKAKKDQGDAAEKDAEDGDWKWWNRPRPKLEDKAMEDAVAWIRSLAQLRGRNVEWAEKAVREAATLSAEDALAENVIDLIAEDLPDLLKQLDGRVVKVGAAELTLKTAEVVIEEIEIDWRARFLSVITNPSIVSILLSLGTLGIIIEFYTGLIFPGVTGGICLILALYGLHVLPVDYAGVALILLGLGLITAEAIVPSFGALGFGGIVAFVVGSVMMLDTDVPGFGISWPIIGSIAAVAAGLMLLTMTLLMRARKRPVVSGSEQMLDSPGIVVDWSDSAGHVRVQGEIWQARSGWSMAPDTPVRITAMHGLILDVEPESKED